MSLWDAFIADYERRRKDLLKQIELTEARLLHTGKSELERWITTTADSLEQAKVDLAEIERFLRSKSTWLSQPGLQKGTISKHIKALRLEGLVSAEGIDVTDAGIERLQQLFPDEDFDS